jgi:hypothetical protein
MKDEHMSTIYTAFPFQLLQLEDTLSIVFENGVLHDADCARNNYIYQLNGLYLTQNIHCGNLQYNKQVSKIFERIEIAKDHTNYRYLNYNQLIDKIGLFRGLLNESKLVNLNKGIFILEETL